MNPAFEALHLSDLEYLKLSRDLKDALHVSTRGDVGLDVTVLGLGSLSHPLGPDVEEASFPREVRAERNIRLLQARWCSYLADVFSVALPIKDQHWSFIDFTFTQHDSRMIRNISPKFGDADIWSEHLDHKVSLLDLSR